MRGFLLALKPYKTNAVRVDDYRFNPLTRKMRSSFYYLG